MAAPPYGGVESTAVWLVLLRERDRPADNGCVFMRMVRTDGTHDVHGAGSPSLYV